MSYETARLWLKLNLLRVRLGVNTVGLVVLKARLRLFVARSLLPIQTRGWIIGRLYGNVPIQQIHERNRAFFIPEEAAGVRPLNRFERWLWKPFLELVYQEKAKAEGLQPWEVNYDDPENEAAFRKDLRKAL